jgi:prolyl-tRNA synthetase
VAIDDRDRPLGWKLNDADLIGYPFIVVLGKAWKARGAVEVQCRRLGVKEEVTLEDLAERLKTWEKQL